MFRMDVSRTSVYPSAQDGEHGDSPITIWSLRSSLLTSHIYLSPTSEPPHNDLTPARFIILFPSAQPTMKEMIRRLTTSACSDSVFR